MNDDDGFVAIDEAAQRMDLTVEQVMELVEKHALRAYRWGGWGQVMVEPAITNVTPARRKPAAKRQPPAKRPARSQRTKRRR
jgi:hypothetical protein